MDKNLLISNIIEILRPDSIFKSLISLYQEHIKIDENFEIHLESFKDIHIFGCGKAASFEVFSIYKRLGELGLNDRVKSLVSYTKTDHSIDCEQMIQLEGTHPVVSRENLLQTKEFVAQLEKVPSNDLIIFALSGGASALLELPIDGVDFELLQKVHKDLLNSGKNINFINSVRKGISKVKNGGLLKHIKSNNIIQFINCDIPNETLADVGSGPLINKKLDISEINAYLEKYGINCEQSQLSCEKQINNFLSISASILLERLEKKSEFNLKIGKVYDCLIDELIEDISSNLPMGNEVAVSGGEATLQIPEGAGLGGRSTHFVIALASKLYEDETNRDIKIMSIGTDGTDGPTDAAGAYMDFDLYKKAVELNLNINEYKNNYDSYHFFKKLGSLIVTGPTRSNVMDLRCVWRE